MFKQGLAACQAAFKTTAMALLVAVALVGCTGMPDKVEPVTPFVLDKYLGQWFEIARLDHSFERGLSQVTANYTMRDDGGVRVINRGFDAEEGGWNEAEGKAYFVDDSDTGHLKVSFFGPFYGSYVVMELLTDEQGNYELALVSGPNTDYLWILSRTPQPDAARVDRLRQRARAAGFDTDALIQVQHGD